MKNTLILKAIRDALRVDLAALAMDVIFSRTPKATMALLKLGPQRSRVILQWRGERPIGTMGNAQEMEFIAIVQAPKGLAAANDDAELDTIDKLNAVVDAIRAMQFQTNAVMQEPLEPKDKGWIEADEFPGEQAFAEFRIAYGPGKVASPRKVMV